MILKYKFMDNIDSILKKTSDQEIKDFIFSMKELILYQMHEIRDQRSEIISLKHKEAWKRYDRKLSDYDTSTRSYVDKPPKSDNMTC